MDNLQIIEKLRHDYWLNFVRALLDYLICANELDLFYKVLGKRLSPGFEGAFGMTAALIYLYSLKRVMKTRPAWAHQMHSPLAWLYHLTLK